MGMIASELVTVIRERVNDTRQLNYTDSEVLHDLAYACRYLALALIGRKDPEMITTLMVSDFTPIPKLFHSFVGQYPVWREGRLFRTSLKDKPVEIRYYAMREGIKTLTDEIPYNDQYQDALVMTTVGILLNRDEFDITSETSMVEAVTNLLPQQGAVSS